MWDKIQRSKKNHKTEFISGWMDGVMESEEYVRQARDAVYKAESKIPEISVFRNVPQSAPWHAEGITLMHHIERMMTGFFAMLNEGFDVLQFEEFAREKNLKLEFTEMQEILREQAATLEAFIILHDIAKQDVISFDAPAGSLGAAEGFQKGSKLKPEIQSQNYLKLARACGVQSDELSDPELAARFYDKYQISVHYYDHPQMAVSEKYESTREAIGDLYRLTARDREMLRLMVRYHMDAILFFKHGADVSKYALMGSRATRSGLDADDYLDIQLAALFLDTTIGTRVYKDRKWISDIDPVLNMLKSEELSLPHRREKRQTGLADRNQKAFKELLKSVGLDSESVFESLEIPFGPDRAQVIEELHNLIKNSEELIDASKYNSEMIKKIEVARGLYVARQA